jgi:class 3 adenylate cyclase
VKKTISAAILVLISANAIIAQDWIPELNAFFLPEEIFAFYLLPDDSAFVNDGFNLDQIDDSQWISGAEILGPEVDQSKYFLKKLSISDLEFKNEATSNSQNFAHVVIEFYETDIRILGDNFQTIGDLVGSKTFEFNSYNLGKIEDLENVMFLIQSNPFAGEEIYLQVSNNAIANTKPFALYHIQKELFAIFSSSVALILSLAMLLLFFIRIRNKDLFLLWFGLFALQYAVFILFNTNTINILFAIPSVVDFYLPLIAQDSMPIFIALFHQSYLKDEWHRLIKFLIGSQILVLVLRLIVMVSGQFLDWADQLALFSPIVIYFLLLFHLIVKQRKNEAAPFFFISFSILGISYGFQLAGELFDLFGTLPIELGPFLFFTVLGSLPIYSYFRQERFIIKQNETFSLFVPQEFLNHLGRDKITELKLGDQIEQTISILFVDIRSFTTISESLTPELTFSFLNLFIENMGPIVRNHNGFVDKYIGDEIMALFTNHPKEAVIAAVAMLEQLESLNILYQKKNLPEIKIGIGIHTGKAMLGIIGENRRYQGTVISDAVNIASRLQNVTKKVSYPLVISEETAELIKPEIGVKQIGRVVLRGKTVATRIYTIAGLSKVAF